MSEVHKSADSLAEQVLAWAKETGKETAFDRADKLKACPVGHSGACCKICFMGPCRLVGKNADTEAEGVCGATLPVVSTRNLLRNVAAGTAAHSDHARDMAATLKAVATGEAKDFQIKDPAKVMNTAQKLGIDTQDKDVMQVAGELADTYLSWFGQQTGEIGYPLTAPKKRVELWQKLGIVPRGIDREVVEAMHRTNMGVDQEPENLLRQAMRTSLADGWGGSMIGTDITDMLFGTPAPIKGKVSLGVFKKNEVNLVVHGHEPSLAEMIVEVISEPELLEHAKKSGAEGINLVGICCTANEVLMRHGISSAGGFLNQELGIMTGLVEAMMVDVQCIMPSLAQAAKSFHTKVITTSPKGKMIDAVHVEYDEHHAKETARKIVNMAIDNYKNRTSEGERIDEETDVVAGFSHEYIKYMQGGKYRGSFRPLNDAIMAGRIRGVVGLVGCNNPRVMQDSAFNFLVEEFIRNDVLVVATGCGAASYGKAGLLTPETALEKAGPGLKEVCEAIGIPPILHLGSCVDNSRILTVATAMVEEGGLGDDISDLPAVGIAPEWMSEKALAIGVYFVASGMYVMFGVGSPVGASKTAQQLISEGWEKATGGKLEFVIEPQKILENALAHIDKKRDALKLKKYEPGKFGAERVLLDMAARREIDKERIKAAKA